MSWLCLLYEASTYSKQTFLEIRLFMWLLYNISYIIIFTATRVPSESAPPRGGDSYTSRESFGPSFRKDEVDELVSSREIGLKI